MNRAGPDRPKQGGQNMDGRQRMRRSVAGAVLAVAMTAGSLAGLGSTVLSAPAGAATPSGSPVVIGDLCSCTGPEASTISQTTDVVKAWGSWVNTHGGLAGHPVQIIVRDDNYNPGQAVTAAQTFVNQDHVVAILDNSDEDPSWGPIVQQAGIPVLGGQETDSGWKNPDFYPPGGTFNYTSSDGAIVAKRAGIKTEAALYCVEVSICQESVDSGESVLNHYGIRYVYKAGIGFAAPSYTAQCLAAKQAGAQSMTVGDASAVVVKVVQDCAAQGYKPVQLSSDGTVAISWLSVPAFNGNIDTQSNIPWFVHNSATKTMYAALAKYAPQVPGGPNADEAIVQSWADAALLQEAIKTNPPSNGASVTSAEIKRGLYTLPQGDDLGGLAPSALHFVQGQPANNSCFDVMGIKNAKFVILNGGKPICAPLVKAGTLPTNS